MTFLDKVESIPIEVYEFFFVVFWMVLIHILSLEREGEGKVYKADAEAVAELDKCYNVLKDMDHSSDMSYPYKSNDK